MHSLAILVGTLQAVHAIILLSCTHPNYFQQCCVAIKEPCIFIVKPSRLTPTIMPRSKSPFPPFLCLMGILHLYLHDFLHCAPAT